MAAQNLSIDTAEVSQATIFLQAKEWQKAIVLLRKNVERAPKFGPLLARLAGAYHASGDFVNAVKTYETVPGITTNPIVMYNAACSYAHTDNKARALELLRNAAAAGFSQVSKLKSDQDLESVRSFGEFAGVVRTVETNSIPPCQRFPEYRQLDFWVGEWDVFNPTGQLVGKSSIQLIEGDCVIQENYTSLAAAYSGKSFNIYDNSEKRWKQFWVDNTGVVLEFSGTFAKDALVYTGTQRTPDGKTTLNRMTFFDLRDGTVRQMWEISTDGGTTWTNAFDGLYKKQKGS
jgi:tetratricopeptide (TPR) repeat protein